MKSSDSGADEEAQKTLALLKVLALTEKSINAGKVQPAAEAFAGISKRVKARTTP